MAIVDGMIARRPEIDQRRFPVNQQLRYDRRYDRRYDCGDLIIKLLRHNCQRYCENCHKLCADR
jgi:hypothetical protein